MASSSGSGKGKGKQGKGKGKKISLKDFIDQPPFHFYEMSFIWAPSATLESLSSYPDNKRPFSLNTSIPTRSVEFVLHNLLPMKLVDGDLNNYERTGHFTEFEKRYITNDQRAALGRVWYAVNEEIGDDELWDYQWNKHGKHSHLSIPRYFELARTHAERYILPGGESNFMDILWRGGGIVKGSHTTSLEFAKILSDGLGKKVCVFTFSLGGVRYLKEVKLLFDYNMNLIDNIFHPDGPEANVEFYFQPMQRRLCKDANSNFYIK